MPITTSIFYTISCNEQKRKSNRLYKKRRACKLLRMDNVQNIHAIVGQEAKAIVKFSDGRYYTNCAQAASRRSHLRQQLSSSNFRQQSGQLLVRQLLSIPFAVCRPSHVSGGGWLQGARSKRKTIKCRIVSCPENFSKVHQLPLQQNV